MILLLNGPFGVGKTTTADLLARRLHGAAVYDPEVIGFVLRRMLRPVHRVADYQDLWLWRRATVWGAWVRRRRRHLIVPMALWRSDYFAETTGGLRRIDARLICVRLTASESTLRQRIESSSDTGAGRWRLDHVASGLQAATDPAFGIEVSTEGRTAAEVAEAIIRLLASHRSREG
jgi:hypothetical protein